MSSLNFNNNDLSLDLNVSLETENFENTDYFIRGRWTRSEDDKLNNLVKYFGPRNWNHIAEHFHGRSGKSCRARWINQLDPKINGSKFNKEEKVKFLAAQRDYGNKWATICKLFPGRTNNQVKNHFYMMMAKMQREQSSSFSRMGNSIFRTPPTMYRITNTTDVPNSACTNVNRFTRPLLYCQAYGSQMGLHGERKVVVGNFGYETNFSAMKGSYVGHMGKINSADKSNFHIQTQKLRYQSQVQPSGLMYPFLGNVKMLQYFDFLGIGDK
ncbi:transcription factor MYB105-like [Trifolium pratense]|uniref:transcription factor MYB105-like n=1 Tax=Trifolium pratense TaxID=57577 RepID=UPI001E690CB5|nr:transcription factor MYB105-like [Trifolium pratense]